MLKSVPWDGPNPQPGDYLALKRGGDHMLIRSVVPSLRHPNQRLVLDLQKADPDQIPKSAVIHPTSRFTPTDPNGPPRIRQLARDGVASVTPARWRDPEDNRPNASRQPRRITGYRTYCPLRRMSEMRSSQVHERHVAAADHFRYLHDLSRIGITPASDPVVVHSNYGPRPGPSASARKEAMAGDAFDAGLRRFTQDQVFMIEAVLLQNRSIYAWCSEQAKRRQLPRPLDQKIEMGRLLAILDILADHYTEAVDAALFATMAV